MEVRQNEDLTLTCIVSDAKPAAQIQWLRNNVEMKTGNSVLFRWYHVYQYGNIINQKKKECRLRNSFYEIIAELL